MRIQRGGLLYNYDEARQIKRFKEKGKGERGKITPATGEAPRRTIALCTGNQRAGRMRERVHTAELKRGDKKRG